MEATRVEAGRGHGEEVCGGGGRERDAASYEEHRKEYFEAQKKRLSIAEENRDEKDRDEKDGSASDSDAGPDSSEDSSFWMFVLR